MPYKDKVITKPWGYEYLAYENDEVGLWLLYIADGQNTSMHCHPKKTTGLVVLGGEVEISFLADKRRLRTTDKVMIRRGLFHSTKSISLGGSYIFEIETPKDKHDLVRLNDKYGRASKAYEGKSFESKKHESDLTIEEPKLGLFNNYVFGECLLTVETIDNIEVINNKQDTDLIMFLKGGMCKIIDGRNHLVTVPGDVGNGEIIKQVSKQLDSVISGTIIMTITELDE